MHLVTAFIFARISFKNISVYMVFFIRLLVIVAIIVSGNRGGLIFFLFI